MDCSSEPLTTPSYHYIISYDVPTTRHGPHTSITCGQCGFVSWHPKDVEHRYCNMCHVFHDIFLYAGCSQEVLGLLKALLREPMGTLACDDRENEE